jgi:uncharacterized protein (TIGR03067 family)
MFRLMLALIGLTAFAPAPLPKPSSPIDPAKIAKLIKGEWRVKSAQQYIGGRVVNLPVGGQRVRVSDNTWLVIHVATDGEGNVIREKRGPVMQMKLDTTRKPVMMDLSYQGRDNPHQRGIIKIEGNTLTVMHTFYSPSGGKPGWENETPNPRPASFDSTLEGAIETVFERVGDLKKETPKK